MKKSSTTALALAVAMAFSGAAFAGSDKSEGRKSSPAKKTSMEDVVKHPIKHLKKFVKKHDRPLNIG